MLPSSLLKNATLGRDLLSRRELLAKTGTGLGMLGLVGLLGDAGVLGSTAQGSDLSAGAEAGRTFPARAKHVIHIYLNGGPSQVDTFDPKPALARYAGQRLPVGQPQHGAADRRRPPLAVSLPSLRGKRAGVQRDLRQDGPTRRRHLRHPLDVLQHPQSRAVDAADEHGRRTALAAQLRLVALVRHGDRQPEPARLHRHVPGAAGFGRLQLALGLSAGGLSGHLHRYAKDP